MRPYGWRMRANDYDGKDEPIALVDKKRAREEGKVEVAQALEDFKRKMEILCGLPKYMLGTPGRELDAEPTRGDD